MPNLTVLLLHFIVKGSAKACWHSVALENCNGDKTVGGVRYNYGMHRTRVGIIRGGPSAEYEISLNSGAGVLKALRENHENRYHLRDIFIDRNGVWHLEGVEVVPESVIHKVDVMFNALHGSYGEDGKIQHFFESHQIPFTGSGSLASAVGMNKVLSKRIFSDHGIKTPYGKLIQSKDVAEDSEGVAREVFGICMMPAVVKPSSSGSSVGISVVRVLNDIAPALELAAEHGDVIIVEEFIPGIEATCGVVEGFRGHDLYALPPIEIRPHAGFFDYDAKYKGGSQEIVPATFDDSIKRELEELAKNVHRLLGLRHYSRSDFIIHPKRGIYVLETNTLPGLTEESLLPKALRAIGSNLHEFADHLIGLAMKRA
jgi:D-alanine-D-alanine ligase